MNTEIKKPNGDLTAYGFACGYVQLEEEVRLYKDCLLYTSDAADE